MPAPTPRTTAALVRGIVDVTSITFDLTPFIAIANELTTDVCGASGYTDGYVGSRMELIERWLAAHFYTIFDNQLAAAKAGTVSVRYQFKTDLGLKSSMYGQQAILLDTNLNLAALDNSAKTKKKITVRIDWLGTNRCWPGDIDSGWLLSTEM